MRAAFFFLLCLGTAMAAEPAVVPGSLWSLQPLVLPEVPAAPDKIGTPVDAFIHQRLQAAGLTLSPEADRATLIRRVTYDLTGLPPSPEEIDAFLSDTSPHAWSTMVDRLLASPRYGERWGRHWLDVARYTESQGFEYDRVRNNAWHYRDYVIQAFNNDKPYDEFMREQIAGDVMEPVTRERIIATSLLVCGPWDEAGNSQANPTQRAITREDELEDLLGVVGQSFLGLTVNCARCHDHKSDPIPQADYYRMRAVFDGVKHGERSITEPAALTAWQSRKAALEEEAKAAEQAARKIVRESAGEDSAIQSGPQPLLQWDFTAAALTAPEGTLEGGASLTDDCLRLSREGAYFKSAPLAMEIREKTLEAWVALDPITQGGGAVISLQAHDGSAFDAITYAEREPGKWMAGSESYARTENLQCAPETAGPGEWLHMAICYHADGRIRVYRNGEPLGQEYRPAGPLHTFPAGSAHVVLGLRHTGGGKPWLTGSIRQAALHVRALTDAEIAARWQSGRHPRTAESILAKLTPEQRAVRDAALATGTRARAALAALTAPAQEVSYTGTRIQPPPARRLHRGDVKSPEEVVSPSALSAIPGLAADLGLPPDAPEALRRMKFAAWLTDAGNPLPARVMANRVWHYHFGQGLVSTPNDFGTSGARPSHPALLDWLAVKFRESGWSIKALHRIILQSATYRQSAAWQENAARSDAGNQLLWRYSPHRLEAEAVRDAMLFASGELETAMGGPGFRPFEYQPFPANSYTMTGKSGPGFNRRTVYRINVNSAKDPLLDAFDCPDPAVKTPRRGTTSTPLQALGLMNNEFVQNQAESLAKRVLAQAASDPAAAIRLAWRLTLGRLPSPEEEQRAAAAATDRGLARVCWVLLNSTEFLYVR